RSNCTQSRSGQTFIKARTALALMTSSCRRYARVARAASGLDATGHHRLELGRCSLAFRDLVLGDRRHQLFGESPQPVLLGGERLGSLDVLLSPARDLFPEDFDRHVQHLRELAERVGGLL